MYTTREFTRMSVFSLAALLGLAVARPVSGPGAERG
jgi:hypothetical protein